MGASSSVPEAVTVAATPFTAAKFWNTTPASPAYTSDATSSRDLLSTGIIPSSSLSEALISSTTTLVNPGSLDASPTLSSTSSTDITNSLPSISSISNASSSSVLLSTNIVSATLLDGALTTSIITTSLSVVASATDSALAPLVSTGVVTIPLPGGLFSTSTVTTSLSAPETDSAPLTLLSTSAVTTTPPGSILTTSIVTTSLSTLVPGIESTASQFTPVPVVTDGTTTTSWSSLEPGLNATGPQFTPVPIVTGGLTTTSWSSLIPGVDSTGPLFTPVPIVTNGMTTTSWSPLLPGVGGTTSQFVPVPIVTDHSTGTSWSLLQPTQDGTAPPLITPTAKACAPLSTEPGCAPPPPCLFDANPCQISSEGSDNENQLIGLFNGIFPSIEHLIQHNEDDISPIIGGLDKINDFVVTLQSHQRDDGGGGGGCKTSILNLFGCIIKSVTKVGEDIAGRVITGLQDRLGELRDLVNYLPKLPTISGPPGGDGGSNGGGGGGGGDGGGNNNNDPTSSPSQSSSGSSTTSSDSSSSSSSSSGSSSSSSSESCTHSTTTEDIHVTCSATTTVSVSGSVSSYVCSTKTSTVSGCSIIGATSTTSILATETAAPDAVCRAETCGADCGVQRRFYAGMNETVVEGLGKKVFEPFNQMAGGYKTWLNTQLGRLEFSDPSNNRIVPEDGRFRVNSDGTADDKGRYAGRTSWKSVEFLNQPTGLGVRGLRGCTAIVVVSKKGAFMAHTWEIPSWLRDARDDEQNKDQKETDSSIWKYDVWDLPYHKRYIDPNQKMYKGLKDLSALGGILDEPQHAVIITPLFRKGFLLSWPQDRFYKYEPRINQLQGYLENILGVPEVSVSGYYPASDALWQSPMQVNGKVLIEFDPEARKTVTEHKGSDGQICKEVTVAAGIRIWHDNYQLIHEDYWEPMPQQKDEDDGSSPSHPLSARWRLDSRAGLSPARYMKSWWGAMARRQDPTDAPACSLVSSGIDLSTVSTISSSIWTSFSSNSTPTSSTSSTSNGTISISISAPSTELASGPQPTSFTPTSTSTPSTFISSTHNPTSTPPTTFANGCTILPWLTSRYCDCDTKKMPNGAAVLTLSDGSITCSDFGPATSTFVVHTTVTTTWTETTTTTSHGSYTTALVVSHTCRFQPHYNPICKDSTESKIFPTYDIFTETIVKSEVSTEAITRTGVGYTGGDFAMSTSGLH